MEVFPWAVERARLEQPGLLRNLLETPGLAIKGQRGLPVFTFMCGWTLELSRYSGRRS